MQADRLRGIFLISASGSFKSSVNQRGHDDKPFDKNKIDKFYLSNKNLNTFENFCQQELNNMHP